MRKARWTQRGLWVSEGAQEMGYTRQGNGRYLSAFYGNGYRLREGFPLFREQEKAGTDNGTQGYWAGLCKAPAPSPTPISLLGSRTGSGARGGEQKTGDLWQGHEGTSRCILESFTQTPGPEQVTHPSRSDGPHGLAQAAGTGELRGQKTATPINNPAPNSTHPAGPPHATAP